ncbi:MAG: hypothetical protein WCO68_10215 [Verrucomicrobiota bacterium]
MNKKSFPLTVEKNGRIGKIYQTGTGRFKIHFQFAAQPRQNMFGTLEAASEFLEGKFLCLPPHSPTERRPGSTCR